MPEDKVYVIRCVGRPVFRHEFETYRQMEECYYNYYYELQLAFTRGGNMMQQDVPKMVVKVDQ